MLLAHVAAEDLHCGDAQAQGEEGLVHGVHDEGAEAVLVDAVKGGEQVELHALRRAGESQAVDGQHHDEDEKRQHHDLCHPLQSLLQAEAAHQEAHDDHGHRQNAHLHGGGEHLAEDGADLLRRHPAAEGAEGEAAEVAHHPARDGGVVHHEKAAAQKAEPAVDVPLLARLFQGPIGQHRALAPGPAHRQLHGQHGDAHDDQADEVEEDEVAAAVLAGDVGEAPDIANADGAARTHQQKAQPGPEGFTFHVG